MSEQQPFDRPMVYQIRIKAHLDDKWSEWLEGLTVTQEPKGETLLCGLVTDQAALHGLLKKMRDLGLPLISVNRVECDREQAGKGDVCNKCQFANIKWANEQNQDKEVK